MHKSKYQTFFQVTQRIAGSIASSSRTVDFCESDSPFHVCLTIRPSAHLVYGTSLLSHFMHIGHHDLNMRILYRLHGWLIFARVIALFMFV